MQPALGFWRALAARFQRDQSSPPPAPSLWPGEPLPLDDRQRLAAAATRARWLKAASHAPRERAEVAAAEGLAGDSTSLHDCQFWRYAYEQRTAEAAALRAALKSLLAVLPEA